MIESFPLSFFLPLVVHALAGLWIGAFPVNCPLNGSESLTVMKFWRTRDE